MNTEFRPILSNNEIKKPVNFLEKFRNKTDAFCLDTNLRCMTAFGTWAGAVSLESFLGDATFRGCTNAAFSLTMAFLIARKIKLQSKS